MAELKDILPERLAEVFSGEIQQITAEKLNVVQSSVSKWLRGEAVPPTETLLYIAKKYRVSADWLLGLSNEKEVDSVSIQNLTYEQIALILHRLIELGSIEIPDLNRFDPVPDDEGEEEREPNYDSDYIKVNDRALSFILRRRWKLYNIGEEYMEAWIDSDVKRFNGVRLLKYNIKTQSALDAQSWSAFKAGDWASLLNEMGEMSPEQIEAMANKKKDGEGNG